MLLTRKFPFGRLIQLFYGRLLGSLALDGTCFGDGMHREEYIESLRTELLDLVEHHLSPVAIRYGYAETPLETNIKWRPQVLILGNYSSGKSTLINDFLGAKVQATGQAPTDDSFTVITWGDSDSPEESIGVVEERDGKFLLGDPEYPFEGLKKHGQRFASHFRLKKVNSPFLKNLALIDTPGMLDSVTERDRGYNYQEVIGDLAQIADLILILFDPHKAGTVREAHTSLRDTLPARTFEDRVVFVLNRIDECASLIDLLQVYGTLCWNLSQMTGRKDIPTIRLTYSPNASQNSGTDREAAGENGFLHFLDNQRDTLKASIQEAPRYRLDNLASFVETHADRLSHMLEALRNYRRRMLKFRLGSSVLGLVASLGLAAAGVFGLMFTGIIGGPDPVLLGGGGGGIALVLWILWMTIVTRYLAGRKHRKIMNSPDHLTPLDNQTRRDSWRAVTAEVKDFLRKTDGKFALNQVSSDFNNIVLVRDNGCREIREALKELDGIPGMPHHSVGDAEEVPVSTQESGPALKRA